MPPLQAELKVPELINVLKCLRNFNGGSSGYEWVSRHEVFGEILDANYDTILKALELYSQQK